IVPEYSARVVFWFVFGSVQALLPPRASAMKFLTVTGDSFSYKMQTMFPRDVLNVAYVPGSRAGAVGAAGLGATGAGGVCASKAVDATSANKAFLIIKIHFATAAAPA